MNQNKKKKKQVCEYVDLSEKQLRKIQSDIHHLFNCVFVKFRLTVRECSYLTGLDSHVFTDMFRNYRLNTLVIGIRLVMAVAERRLDAELLRDLLLEACAQKRSLAVRVMDDDEPLRRDEFLLIGPRRKSKGREKTT